MPILSEQGYLILAVNTQDTDYVACAKRCAESIKEWHFGARVCLVTDKPHDDPIFDCVRILPHGDTDPTGTWKLSNDWQAYTCSPFRQTIKLEADMVAAGPIDHWWHLFEQRELVISQGCRDFYDQTSQSRFYRKQFDINHLPDVYNAITYWRVGPFAQEFFELVRTIFENWASFRTLLKFSDEYPTTDVVYAMAAKIVGPELCTLPVGLGPSITHMKRHVAAISSQDWTKELVWEHTQPGLRINTVAQHGFFHYHVKEWAREQ